MSGQPAFLLSVLEEERAELESLGVTLAAPDGSAATQDQWADALLQLEAQARADVARYQACRAAWIEQITQRYDNLIQPLVNRATLLNAAVCVLAKDADFGRKKSRALAYGSYGRRQVPFAVTVEEPDAVLAWAQVQAPSLVRLTIQVSGDVVSACWAEMTESVRALFAEPKMEVSKSKLKEHVKATGEEPPGVVIEAAHDEPFAKPAA